jgi:hypothetical protein
MFFPARQIFRVSGSSPNETKPPVSSNAWRIAVVITFLVSALLLIDQQLETVFDAAEIVSLDAQTYRVKTSKASFLAAFPASGAPELQRGELVVMELSPLTNTVVAYKQYEALLVESPRENIFTYWPITLLMALTSAFLITRWKNIGHHIELLMLNLILLVIVSILYFVSH